MADPRLFSFRCYVRPKVCGAPSEYLDDVLAEDAKDARTQAEDRWPDHMLDIISDIQWQAMSKDERRMAEGTYFTADDKIRCPKGVYATVDARTRSAQCQGCGEPIYYTRDKDSKWRKPPRFHKDTTAGESCLHRHQLAFAVERANTTRSSSTARRTWRRPPRSTI